MDKLSVSHPIEQNVQGSGGYFEARNLVQPKITFKAYRKYAEREGRSVEGKSIEEREKLVRVGLCSFGGRSCILHQYMEQI